MLDSFMNQKAIIGAASFVVGATSVFVPVYVRLKKARKDMDNLQSELDTLRGSSPTPSTDS